MCQGEGESEWILASSLCEKRIGQSFVKSRSKTCFTLSDFWYTDVASIRGCSQAVSCIGLGPSLVRSRGEKYCGGKQGGVTLVPKGSLIYWQITFPFSPRDWVGPVQRGHSLPGSQAHKPIGSQAYRHWLSGTDSPCHASTTAALNSGVKTHTPTRASSFSCHR